jgi:hypothetical protein
VEHIKEFNLFGRSKPSGGNNEKLEIFLEENWRTIQNTFDNYNRLRANSYEIYNNSLFAVSFDPPNNEMPTDISYIMESIVKRVSLLIGDDDLTWRFGVDDPFLIRFILSGPFE